jgi:hypothetical protein
MIVITFHLDGLVRCPAFEDYSRERGFYGARPIAR